MEDQMIHGERKGNQSSPMEYKVQYKLGTIEMCVYFLPFPLPDFFPSFHLPSLPQEPGHTACDFLTALIYCIGRMKKTCIES